MLDRVEIIARSGDGGAGVVSFRREKFVPRGGPDGGDGGNGGEVIIMADSNLSTLHPFERKRFFRAGDGANGRGKKQHGKKGQDLILRVPVGTLVWAKAEAGDELMADLAEPSQQVTVARGGQGGRGNARFTSATNRAPRITERGELGEEHSLILELRLIADVGIIGYPNVGKSTLLAAASAAKPKIASYPFTTLEPVLGIVEADRKSFVLAEIPGLIEEAHLGRGLGHDFLRHALRTKILIHLLDGTVALPVEDMARVNAELGFFDSVLAQKPQLVAVNKIDLPQVRARLAEIEEAFQQVGIQAYFLAAATGEGVAELMAAAAKRLSQLVTKEGVGEMIPQVVFRPKPHSVSASVHMEGDTFIVIAPELERIAARVDMTSPEVRWQFRKQLARLGVSQALAKAGIKPGDKVRCGQYQWEW